MAYAGDKLMAPLVAGHCLRCAYPAGGVFIVLPLAVPMKLNFNPPVGVGVDFIGFGAGDDGCLGAECFRVMTWLNWVIGISVE